MSKMFPTAVIRAGNDIVYRLCDADGNRKTLKERFKPELFVPAPHGTPVSVADAFALRGEPDPRDLTPLVRMEFDNIYDFTNYVKENKDVPGVRLYGMTDPVLQAYTRAFPEEIEPSFKHIRAFNLDIEVVSSFMQHDGTISNGPFPEPIIERPEFRTKAFDDEKYANQITEFYRWWSLTFPDSVIPIWNNMNSAFPIVSLQLSDKNAGKYIVWDLPLPENRGKFKYNPDDPAIGNLEVEVREFTNEQTMLADFVRYWSSRSPDCWTGWNIKKFDAPYLGERLAKILGEDWIKALSPIGRFRRYTEKPEKGMPYQSIEFTGCPALSYDDLYKKHRLKERSSYSLDHIAHVELEEGKLDYSEHQSLNTLWFMDHEKFIRYGIKDIVLVDKLDKKLEFLNLTFMLGALYYCNYGDTLGTVTPWLSLMFHQNYHHGRKGKHVPLIKRVRDNDEAYDGAFVHTPIPGRYEDIISEDLNSLYPHIEQQYNMGPETKVTPQERRDILFELVQELEDLKTSDFTKNRSRLALISAIRDEREIIEELINFGPHTFQTLIRHGVSMTPNLQFFINEFQSCYSTITREKYTKRKSFKNEMLHWEQVEADLKGKGGDYHEASDRVSAKNTSQMGVKILLNAGYGAIGNRWFKEYYDPHIARAITASGELINKWITKYLSEDLRDYSGAVNHRFVVYGDTDSIYLCLSPIVKANGWDKLETIDYVSSIDKFEREYIQPKISDHCELMAKTMNAFEQRMFWGREVICKHGGIFQAKKRYALLVDNSEGVQYSSPKLKVTGLESKKSTTPELCVPWLENIYKMAIKNDADGIYSSVKEYRETYYGQPPEAISVASSVSNVQKYRNRGTWDPIEKTPYNSSAALLHNKLISETPDARTPMIQDGSKIMLVNLKKPNPLGNRGYLAFQGYWPQELNYVREYIDYPGLFEKSFIAPAQLLLDSVKMTTKRKVNVFSFAKKKES